MSGRKEKGSVGAGSMQTSKLLLCLRRWCIPVFCRMPPSNLIIQDRCHRVLQLVDCGTLAFPWCRDDACCKRIRSLQLSLARRPHTCFICQALLCVSNDSRFDPLEELWCKWVLRWVVSLLLSVRGCVARGLCSTSVPCEAPPSQRLVPSQ